ncbi:FAD-dependent monooxygenase [Curvibacter sp. APW13]|uniref:FAD-dependent monooxygenase n=1 Tax=Curvibacter sp. APW13 TaxID=3077236 RepID=UPI0028DF7B40|nr:FAD-dependent monooxygenase [Curvibacter sp. APW13]MDT8989364.1 FAD-dependent monooxygenase [Curvibacter sp. APW13]
MLGKDERYDVLINGLGPVGAALACLLGQQGLKVCAIDKATKIFEAPRAIALDNEALRILQMAGLAEGSFETIAIPEVNMHSPLLGRYNRIAVSGAMDGHPRLVTFFQPELEMRLRAQIARLLNVQVRLGCELVSFAQESEGIRAQIRNAEGDSEEMTARYLVGADGAGSTIRRLLGLDFKGETYVEDWLVVDVKNAPKPIDHIEFICDPGRPAPHMPAPGGRQRWEFKLQPGESREQMEKPEVIRDLLKPWDPDGKSEIERVAVYRFHARVADTFSKGRVFLVGDAAHITPPFVGQGLVAGLRDAANLSWKLVAVCKGWSHPALLQTYDPERRPHAQAMIDVAKLMGKLVMPRNKALAWFAHGLVLLMRQIPRLRRYLETAEIKPPHVFLRGALVPGRASGTLVRGGLFPQGWIRFEKSSAPAQLSDSALRGQLTLVGFGIDPRACLPLDCIERWLAHGGQLLTIHPRGRFEVGAYEDASGDWVGTKVPLNHLVTVRPDCAVICDAPATQGRQLVEQSLTALHAA